MPHRDALMERSSPGSRRRETPFRLGTEHVVKPRAATISDAAQEHHVDRKAMKVLSFLAANPGIELSKEQILFLLQLVWEVVQEQVVLLLLLMQLKRSVL